MRTGIMLGVALLVASAAQATILVEAEDFVASYNAGGNSIAWVSCSGASGGRAVEGFDAVGDWIEIMVTVPETYGYDDSLHSAGEYGIESDIAMRIFGAYPGGGDVASAYHTIGEGIGWSSANYTLVAGSDNQPIVQGYYTLRLTLTQGGRTRLDYVSLTQSQACAGAQREAQTWGQIKALWR